MYSKYERRTDTRTYDDRKKLYEGGWEVIRAESLDAIWKEKYEEWSKRPAKRLPKWFGERPGKKSGDPETPEGEEGGDEEAPMEEEVKLSHWMTITIMTMIITLMIMTTWRRERALRLGGKGRQEKKIKRRGENEEGEIGRVKIQRPAKMEARGIRRRKTRIRKVKGMATKEKTNPVEVGKEATKIQTANPTTKRKERGKTARIAGKKQIKTESLSTKILTKPHQKKMRRR